MIRTWTDADQAAAKELGFYFMSNCRYWTGLHLTTEPMRYSSEYRLVLASLYVWYLAQEEEPTAVKALDVIQECQPDEFEEIVRVVMWWTCNGT